VVYEITYTGTKIPASNYAEFARLLRNQDFSLVSLVRATEDSRRAINLQGTSIDAVAKRIERKYGSTESREAPTEEARQAYDSTERAARRVGSAFAETGERILSSIVPSRTEESPVISPSRRARPAEVVPAIREIEIEATAEGAAEAAPATAEAAPRRRGQVTHASVPIAVMRGHQSVNYEFEITYDPSRLSEEQYARLKSNLDRFGMVDAAFFDRPENRAAVIRFRYRQMGSEYGAWKAGSDFHNRFITTARTPMRYEIRDRETNEIVGRLNIYVDTDKARDIPELRDPSQITVELLRDLQKRGLVAGISTPSEGRGETVWVRGNLDTYLARIERLGRPLAFSERGA
ncbi:MAG TPA: hypothetical protein PKJ97_03550, partial [Candidatus Bilamarchaeaceae archaeon]|nr:hypothetical protein [Candidatus Bilamarchaeaceae archaeon]